MTEQEKIERIAEKIAQKLIKDARADIITTVQEVHDIIVKLLSDEKTLEIIKDDVKSEAPTHIVYENMLKKRKANEILDSLEPTLDQLIEDGLNYRWLGRFIEDEKYYGSKWCMVSDDGEMYTTLEDAIQKCIVTLWWQAFINELFNKLED